jgi:ribonuclease J
VEQRRSEGPPLKLRPKITGLSSILVLPLDAAVVDAALLPAVRGLLVPDPSLLAILLSHGHRDHWGLLPVIRADLPVILGEATHRILSAAAPFVPGTIAPTNVRFIGHLQQLALGPFHITPLLVDHSAYDAYALLIERGGKRLLCTGDLRAHGRKANRFERLVKHPPQNIDVMPMEGTAIGRDEENYLTEADLEDALVAEFDQKPGLKVRWSPQYAVQPCSRPPRFRRRISARPGPKKSRFDIRR